MNGSDFLNCCRASRNRLVRDSRPVISSKYKVDLDKYRATIVTLFKNGDPWYSGHELRFMPGRDFQNLDGFLLKANERLDFLGGVKYMFDTEGERITSLEQASYL
jgi:hypothetical protein